MRPTLFEGPKPLLGEGKALYRQLVNILRTACKGPNEALLSSLGLAAFLSDSAIGTLFVRPTGSGWRELILFTHRNITMFDLTDAHIVIGLLKDWAQGLDISKPLPIETKPAAEICLHYLALLRAVDLYGDTREHEFIQLLFKVPHAAPAEVTDLIRSALSNRSSNRSHARAVLEHVTKSFECQPLCIHFPDLVIEAAEATWRASQKEYDPDYSLPDVDEAFGFIHSAYFDYFPPSALQGPFAFLLSSHSEVGIDFIVRMANEGAASYARSIFGNEVTNVTIHTSTGSRPIIASPRLWALYRGMMPGASSSGMCAYRPRSLAAGQG